MADKSYSLKKQLLYVLGGRTFTLRPKGSMRGRVLLSHDITAFLRPDTNKLGGHGNYWTARQIAQTFLDQGYVVDVINSENRTFIPKKKYVYCVDIGPNLERIAQHLNQDCIKIYNVTASHWMFQNAAEYKRCLDLQHRRGVTIFPSRLSPHSHSAEIADYIAYYGNDTTAATYAHVQAPMFATPIPTTDTFPFPETKNFEAARKQFIWIGGAGAVHKGLDLVLEAFARMPEYRLIVVGKVGREHDFAKAYKHELEELPNIHMAGVLDTGSDQFRALCDKSLGVVFPSCSEGQAGSVIVSMHAGLIPIITKETGVDIGDFGILLKDASIATIADAVRELSAQDTDELQRRARMSWESVNANNTRDIFAKRYKDFIAHIEATDNRIQR